MSKTLQWTDVLSQIVSLICNFEKVNALNRLIININILTIAGYYVLWKTSFVIVFIIFTVMACLGCISNHNKALKSKNMVRYQFDVIKRKDIIRLKKNTC